MIDHTPINFHNDRLTEIQSILNKLEPHEHADGINECAICDQGLDEAILLELRKTLVLREIRSRKPLEGETVCPPAPQEQEKQGLEWVDELLEEIERVARVSAEQFARKEHGGQYDQFRTIEHNCQIARQTLSASIERLSAPPTKEKEGKAMELLRYYLNRAESRLSCDSRSHDPTEIQALREAIAELSGKPEAVAEPVEAKEQNHE